MVYRLFGIRHHGPGCARSLKNALESFEPDCVLIEGPPDAASALDLLASPDLRPPVALLIHDVEDPRRGVFYPFAVFSPEWQALLYASARAVPARFIDLPVTHSLALDARRRTDPADVDPLVPLQAAEGSPGDTLDAAADDQLREDPLGMLAEAAGFSDREQWWDVQVEQRREATGLFEAIAEAMTQVRLHAAPSTKREQRREDLREAYMRVSLRKATKEGFQRIAVICGAWHVPALSELGGPKQAKADSELLKGLPKLKVASTWIPWTHSRLSYRSGYGAGVDSPGWYAHLWQYAEGAPLVWAVRAARLLRSEDLDASSASAIETVRLALTLAAVRELPSPGLNELREAILAVLCSGDSVRLTLIRERLEVGEELGAVPEGAAQVPLQRDFAQQAKRLRLKLTPEPTIVQLDLRKDNDRDKSRLFHRLHVLGIEWGEPLGSGNTSGTFRENWRLAWAPELALELVAANLFGNTVAIAAREKLRARAKQAHIADLSAMLELTLLADLPDAMTDLLTELDARAAHSGDVGLLLNATEPLARVLRYGDVRGSGARAIEPVFRALLERAIVRLAPACSQLDDTAAASLLDSLQRAHAACLLVDHTALKDDWLEALAALLDAQAVHPRIRGRACRLLLEQNRLSGDELERRAHLALSSAVEPASATRWLEGLIAGDGLFLVHQATLLDALDAWLSSLTTDVFQAELPLLRRAFASFAVAERRALGRRLKRGAAKPSEGALESLDFDGERARRVLPVLANLLGVDVG